MAKRRRSHNKMVITREDGEPVQIELGEALDLTVPQVDDSLGFVPEFVNVDKKVQIVPIPDQPGVTFEVPPMGILRGAQWRHLASHQPAWGRTAPFVERTPGDYVSEVDGKKSKVPYDPKYLLTAEQMIDHVTRLGNRNRIRMMVQNAVYVETDQVTRLGYRRNHAGPVTYRNSDAVDARPRAKDDREKVTSAAMDRVFYLEDEERKRKEERGLLEAGSV